MASASSQFWFIGKEASRRWEQGDDPSMVDFRCREYSNGKVVADNETRERIVQTGIRKVARETGINKETVLFICQRKPVKAITLAKVSRFISETVGPRVDIGEHSTPVPTQWWKL
jgi:hypothetical protein